MEAYRNQSNKESSEIKLDDENSESYDAYYDMEEELERSEASEEIAGIWRKMASSYISQEQLAMKGSLLGYYKSKGFRNTYIEVYEKAFIGKAEAAWPRKTVDIRYGYFCLKEAIVEKGVLYLIMDNNTIYRLRNIKMAEDAAYRLNEQKRITEGQNTDNTG